MDASIGNSIIEGAKFPRAIRNGCKIKGTKVHGNTQLDPKAKLAWRLNHEDMTGADLSNADLSEMNVLIGRLEMANLSNANLQNASFRFCPMDEANLSGIQATAVNLSFSRIHRSCVSLKEQPEVIRAGTA